MDIYIYVHTQQYSKKGIFHRVNNDGMVNTIESAIGIEEAYAGPCGRRGCEGRVGDCDGTSYTIFAIGDLEIYRYCKGIKKSEDQFEEEG